VASSLPVAPVAATVMAKQAKGGSAVATKRVAPRTPQA
jgi:hypothetical protein